MNKDVLIKQFYEYKEALEKYQFFCAKYAWLKNCPYNVDVEKGKVAEDVICWRKFSHKKENELVDSIGKL